EPFSLWCNARLRGLSTIGEELTSWAVPHEVRTALVSAEGPMTRGTVTDIERRAHSRTPDGRWKTALTSIAPNAILIRGYPVDEMMGRLSFADAVYLLLMGELPPPAIGRMLNAVLVSSLDHGVTPPSTLAARNVATSGAPLKDCVAAGIL